MPLISAAGPTPPAPTQWVTDPDGFLSHSKANEINGRLAEYQNKTGHQIMVWIGKSTGGDPIEDWAANTFKAWRIGRKGFDDGLVLFIMTQDRTARIEVGYGLEGLVTDADASRILRETLLAGIRNGQQDQAVSESVDRIISLVGQPPVGPAGIARTVTPGQIILFAILAVLLIVLVVRYPALGYYLLWIVSQNIFRGSNQGPNARGGGGRSGGGGASGRW